MISSSAGKSAGEDLRTEAAFQMELILPLVMAACGNRLAMRERHRRDLRQIEEARRTFKPDGNERLSRIQGWKQAVTGLQYDETQLENILRSSRWLDKARGYVDPFVAHMDRRAEKLRAQVQPFHEKLMAWQAALDEREALQKDSKKNSKNARRPVYVSRARKRPELQFVNQQDKVSDEFL